MAGFQQTVQLIRSLGAVTVRNNVNQSIPNNAVTTASWAYEEFDTGGFHSTTTNTDRLTATATGKYLGLAAMSWKSAAAGRRVCILSVNDGASNPVQHSDTAPSASTSKWQQLVTVVELDTGDYLTVQVLQSSGAALDLLGFSSFSMARLS